MKEENLQGKICIVTGANSGLGKATTQLLVEKDAYVIMVVRNKEKGQKVLDEIKTKTQKSSLELMLCDFSSQKSIRNFVENFRNNYSKLDILINNHGAVFSKKELTKDGIERTFAINYLSFFMLTNLLQDIIISNKNAKIINVSSGAFAATRKWFLHDYNFEQRKYFSFKAYSESKLYDIMFTYYLAEKLKNSGTTVNSYSPGFTRTNFGSGSLIMRASMLLLYPFGRSPLKSAETAIFLACSSAIHNITGKYYENLKLRETSSLAQNQSLQKELWDLSLKLTGLTND